MNQRSLPPLLPLLSLQRLEKRLKAVEDGLVLRGNVERGLRQAMMDLEVRGPFAQLETD